ncbi:MAG TPA: YdeI/OmpD-associated family protein [Acidimicrobiales bacterium]|nr:YdeI/OmpD-associated family protein [Acidimicrobiales bacterium]
MELPELVVADAVAWREWLGDHHAESKGVWLVLAKKGTNDPTSLSYDEALDDAICFGWIDGQLRGRDAATFRRRFTPRQSRSAWSQRNVTIAEKLTGAGRMHAAGEVEVQRAKEDGRWKAAYAGQATSEVPDDLARALAANPLAQAKFQELTSANRYAILYRIENAKKLDTRFRRIEKFVEMLARGETIHPQRPG